MECYSKRVLPSLITDKGISLWGNRMVLSGVNTRENSLIVDIYQKLIKIDCTWFLINNTKILWQQKLLCSSKDISFLYLLTCEKVTDFWATPPISLNSTAEVGSTSELITETAEILMQLL